MLTATLGVVATLVFVLAAEAHQPLLLAVLLVATTLDFARLRFRAAKVDAVVFCSGGHFAVVSGGRTVVATLLAGSLMGAQFAWLRWRLPGACRIARWSLALRRDNAAHWRKARVLWRWAPLGRRPTIV